MDIFVDEVGTKEFDVSDDRLIALIVGCKAFTITDCKRLFMLEISRKIEQMVETCGFKCSVSTRGRFIAGVLILIPTPVTVVAGWAALAASLGQSANILNDEYQITRNFITGNIIVEPTSNAKKK